MKRFLLRLSGGILAAALVIAPASAQFIMPSGGGGGSATSLGPFPVMVSGTVTSGGIPCFDSTTDMKTSALLGSGHAVIGGGAGSCPSDSKITLTVPATGSTLTIVDGKTATFSNTLTLAGTDGSTLNVGTGGTLGTAAFKNTGTSGNTVPLLDGTNTWTNTQSFSANVSLGSTGILQWNSDSGIYRGGAAGTLSLARTGSLTSPATLQIYNSVDNPNSPVNYERLNIGGTGSGFTIGTVAGGTGSVRNLIIQSGSALLSLGSNGAQHWQISVGNLVAATDNSFDFGALGASRARTGYFGTSLFSPIISTATGLTLTAGAYGLTKITASASAPGAAGGKLELVCGTNAGSAKLIAYAGTSSTAVTVLDNIGSGVTGC